jgi:hypothetical protein
MSYLTQEYNSTCNINTHFSFDVFYAVINLKIVNFYKPWFNMKILMLFHDFYVINLLFHDFDVIDLLFHDFDVIDLSISVTNHIYHGSYS